MRIKNLYFLPVAIDKTNIIQMKDLRIFSRLLNNCKCSIGKPFDQNESIINQLINNLFLLFKILKLTV
jgi:hypothetical protein